VHAFFCEKNAFFSRKFTPFPCIGQIWAIFILVCWIMGLVAAINEDEKEVPLIGKIRILK